jgi:SAM-dependent methyltransferase
MRDELYSQHGALEDKHWWFVGRRKIILPLVREALRGREDELIVDVGCSTGGNVAAFSQNFRCLGVDCSAQAIAMARAKYPKCRFMCGKMPESLWDTAGWTALYILMDVLEHIDEDRKFLADVVSLSRPGGHVLVTVPAKPILWSGHDVAAVHQRRYEPDTLTDLWRGLPVEARAVTYFNARLYGAIWAARVIGKRVGLFRGQAGSDFSMPPAILNSLLTWIFAGESRRVSGLLANPPTKPYGTGVSLLALLRRTG